MSDPDEYNRIDLNEVIASLRQQLATAYERIGELEEITEPCESPCRRGFELIQRVKELETYVCNDVRDLKIDLAAERAISDKMEKTLEYASQIIGHPDDSVSKYIRSTLAELAAMRKGETE